MPAAVLALMITFLLAIPKLFGIPLWAIISVEIVLAIVLTWVLSFFRDPYRTVPTDQNLLLAPADGRITDIEIVSGSRNSSGSGHIGIGGHGDPDLYPRNSSGETLRIGIFLSIFDAHINRAPCNAKVETITYREGRYKNAMNPASGRVNESNNLRLARTDSPQDRLIVRQISGAIARRIVCKARQGQELASGEKFGMIKFGSRTELYVPARSDLKCLVQIGDKVRAGMTPLVRYEAEPFCGDQLCPD